MASKRIDLFFQGHDRVSNVAGGVTSSVKRVGSALLSLPTAIIAGLSIAAITKFTNSAVDAFGTQEKAISDLTTALEGAGDAGASTLPQLQAFASGLQSITTQGDEATLALAAEIATLGNLSGDALKNATAATLGLARVTGQDASTAARAYLNATQGNFGMLERYIPAIRDAATETEKMAIVTGFASKGMDLMQADAQTSTGRWQQMKNAVGDLMETIGGGLAPVFTFVAERIMAALPVVDTFIRAIVGGVGSLASRAMPVLQAVWDGIVTGFYWVVENVLPLVVGWVRTVTAYWGMLADAIGGAISFILEQFGMVRDPLETLGGWFKSVAESIDLVLAALEFGFENWRTIVELVFLKTALAAVNFRDNIVHIFSVVIPQWLTWLADNWQNIFIEIAAFTTTVFDNLANNIVGVMKNLPGLIRGSVDFTDLWTPLTDGFEATLLSLPDIADKQASELAQVLGANVNTIQRQLGNDFSDFLVQRGGEIEGLKQAALDLFKTGAGGAFTPNITSPTVTTPGGDSLANQLGAGGAGSSTLNALRISSRFQGNAERFTETKSERSLRAVEKNTTDMARSIDRLVSIEERRSMSNGGLQIQDVRL